MIKKLVKIVYMSLQGVWVFLWFIGKPATDMVYRNDSVARGKETDHLPVIVRPGRIAVYHNNGRPLSFVNKMQAIP